MHVETGISLAHLTTLGLGGAARTFAKVTSLDDLIAALAFADRQRDPVLIVGGGSNLLVRDGGWNGLAIQLALSGVHIDRRGDHALVTAAAGVPWDAFVAEMVGAHLVGVECLSGIPGLVGATPMQNVGAYGQEVADTIDNVRALDRTTGELVDIAPADCGFGYRASKFKHVARWIIVAVRFRLATGEESAPLRYAELTRTLDLAEGGRAPLAHVRDTIIRLRRAKGMVVDAEDPDSRSAGSFFTNPIVDAAQVAAFRARLGADETPPTFAAANGMTKLSAGWLIERAGFTKGTTRGNVGISTKHALALINRGGGTATELLALAHEIQLGVRAQLGVDLTPEPVIVGT